MCQWHNEMVEFNARKEAAAEADREAGRIPETAGRAGSLGPRVWAELSKPAGHQHRLAAVAERCGTTPGTVRKYVRDWSAAGYVHLDNGTARLPKEARATPPNLYYDCGGKLVYVDHPNEEEYTVIDRTSNPRRPEVTRRRRGAHGPGGEVVLADKDPGETLAQYYERKNATPVDTDDPAASATLPAVTGDADLPALLDAGQRALAQATTDLERMRVRDGARAYQEAARVLKRADVLVDASILVQTAERAIAAANPGVRTGRGHTVAVADIEGATLRRIRSAHAHVDDALFRRLVAAARADGAPLTRQLVARAGRDARGAPSPRVVHYSGNFEWTTPPHIIEAARRVMGGIDLDPASSDAAQAVVGAARYYTAHEDGVKRAWAGRVWLNPPYAAGLVSAFVARLIDHVRAGKVTQAVLLTNNSTDTAWWQGAAAHAYAVCLLAGRLSFLTPAGNPATAPIQGQSVLYFAREPDDGVERFAREFRGHGMVLYPVLCEDAMEGAD